ncbi:MAG: phosphoribosylaminoimidazolesuccinocarboxamide synthase [Candidatus Omnitrophica bacterium CG1_02_44_16]|nr:MAG: phosphoribosylaminoimidazolesuccinocarboxamide synthase [Candidatus Omnitrophica bacterium CG1_02_44_16]PIY82461.1 MAG: phosphoribosylaminoimidazolesuccinocarboxamide synthase [Candidatus Omnitrophica bacterium CG_4_10_14_0_8_um_filter_44_12]PIZ84651.1 MAG: phosphoribosylaminoimidazolesuccinocarboxamide synthase [Candidatus Omnitrophica bacterium CG_4_10_14_0_2_um_filter_44_9]
MQKNIVLKTEFPDIKLSRRGKVRDVYDLGDKLLIVATDRISCFDVVLGCGIPEKGRVLTKISLFWFDYLKGITGDHLLTADVLQYPKELRKYKDELSGRSMLVKKARPMAIECIVRGYLSGSGWKEYRLKSSVCGIALPGGLRESEKLPQAVFTPSTKAEVGHDINIDEAAAIKLVGKDAFREIKEKSIGLYEKAARYALTKGIIIADTKFEFGEYEGKLILIDEILTPDSSRFWPTEGYTPGKPQPSFDKQFVRDYLETLNWDKTPPAPQVAPEIIEKTSQKYIQAFKVLTN